MLAARPKLPLDPLIKREPAWSFRLHSISRFGQKRPTGVSVKIHNRIPILTDAEETAGVGVKFICLHLIFMISGKLII